MFDTAGLEADHLQLRALAKCDGQFGERVVGSKQDAQPVQPVQVIRQAGKLVAGQIQHFQAVRQAEQLAGKLAQAQPGQADMAGAGQCASFQIMEGMHGGEV